MLYEESSDYGSDNELDQLNLINRENDKYLYRALSDVIQECYLTLKQAPEGIMSSNFSTCFAVIMKDKKTNNSGLAHVSSITNNDVNFFNDMMLEVSENKSDVIITLARSQQTYAKQHQQELKDYGYNTGEQTAEEYFAQYDPQYLNFFKKHFPECTINLEVLEMPHSCIVINANGVVDLLKQYKSSSIELEQYIPPSPVQHASNPHVLMPATSSSEDEDNKSVPGPIIN